MAQKKLWIGKTIERMEWSKLDTEIQSYPFVNMLIYEAYNSNMGSSKPAVIFSDSLHENGITYSLAHGYAKSLEVDGTPNPDINFYPSNNQTISNIGNALLTKMKNRIATAGRQSLFSQKMSPFLNVGTTASTNAFTYLQTNLMKKYKTW